MATSTHYDILKVAKDAPSEIIRAAYKVLVQKYNTDRNQNDEHTTALDRLNDAFTVLSNPAQRAEYDQWLGDQESGANASKSERPLGVEKENSESSGKNEKRSYRWLLFGAIGLATFAMIGWFVFSDNENASKTKLPPKQVEITNTTATQPVVSETNPDLSNDSIPTHDQVAMNQFIGKWKGENADSAVLQTLEISSKTDNSLIFLLDAKAGQGIGGVYGIADYQDGYARFYNSEYGCSILLTMQSNIVHVTTSGCQAYHAKGVTFDGGYVKPTAVKVVQKPVAQTKPIEPKATAGDSNQIQQFESKTVVAKNTPKLVKFMATVKDSEGNVNTFELVAKDKKAAKEIIRDFRGNPKIVKIKEVKN